MAYNDPNLIKKGDQVESMPTGCIEHFWKDYETNGREDRNQPGNPYADGEKHVTVSQEKAKEILSHGSVHGKELTEKQKGFFGARAGGEPYKK